ncbi:MAG: hypothetical protein ABR583_06825 [Gaiellaceae bacterium]
MKSGSADRVAMRYAPLAVYLVVYGSTCLLGASLLLSGSRWFTDLFELFAGVDIPVFDEREMRDNLRLLLVAPILVVFGYIVALHVPVGGTSEMRPSRRIPDGYRHRPRLIGSILSVFAAVGLFSVGRAGGVDDVSAWFEYGDFIDARRRAFERLTYLEFVNIYMFLPVSTAYVVLAHGRVSRRTVALRGLAVLIAVGLPLLLFQKRPALMALILIAAALILHADDRGPARRTLAITAVVSAVAGATLYFGALVVPVHTELKNDLSTSVPGNAAAEHVPGIVLFSAFAPLTRTASAAIFYPAVYPEEHPYAGLDVGQDLLGLGEPPRDNVVVFERMYPGLGGNAAAPLQFAFYSQIGPTGALIASALAGFLLGVLWRLRRLVASESASVAGALIIVLAVYYASDSVRNGLLAGYGVVWGLLVVLGIELLRRPGLAPQNAGALVRAWAPGKQASR